MTPTEAIERLDELREILAGLPNELHVSAVQSSSRPYIQIHRGAAHDYFVGAALRERDGSDYPYEAQRIVGGVEVCTLIHRDALPRWAAEQLRAERDAQRDALIDAALGAE